MFLLSLPLGVVVTSVVMVGTGVVVESPLLNSPKKSQEYVDDVESKRTNMKTKYLFGILTT